MSAFANIVRAVADRNFGGTDYNQVAEPYITGYHFSKWVFPNQSSVLTAAKSMAAALTESPLGGIDSITDVFEDTCLSITPPGGTINKTEIQGLGGTKWSVPTNIDYGTSLSCKFLEMSGLPIFSIIHNWCKYIRDNKSGLTALTGTDYNKSKYSAVVFYWTTKPDGKTVEFASCYSGVFPLKDPQDLFAGDLSSVDKLEMDIEFNVDFIYQDKWVYNSCQNWATVISDSIVVNRMKESGSMTDNAYHNGTSFDAGSIVAKNDTGGILA